MKAKYSQKIMHYTCNKDSLETTTQNTCAIHKTSQNSAE